MKRIFLLSAMILFAFGAMAQGHLKFQGVEMDCSLREFTKRLNDKGIEAQSLFGKVAMGEIEFCGYKECDFMAVPGKEKRVGMVVVMLSPQKETWGEYHQMYTTLKSALTKQNGNPTKSEEEFEGVQPATDAERLQAFKSGKCKWATIYDSPQGAIVLAMLYDAESGATVAVQYMDKQNFELPEDLLND